LPTARLSEHIIKFRKQYICCIVIRAYKIDKNFMSEIVEWEE